MVESTRPHGDNDDRTNAAKKNLHANTTYNADRVCGNGSFGVVFQATRAETGEVVAIKKVY